MHVRSGGHSHRRGAQKNLAAAVELGLLRTNYDRAAYSGIREITSPIARCVRSRSMAHLWHTVGELVFNWFTDSSGELVHSFIKTFTIY